MGIMEAPRLSQNPNDDKNLGQLGRVEELAPADYTEISLPPARMIRDTLMPLISIEPVLDSMPEISEILRRLGEGYANGSRIINDLATNGIFAWQDEDGTIGLHVKKDNGRDHSAYIKAKLTDKGIGRLDMDWQNGTGPYSITLLPGALPPKELATALNDVVSLQREWHFPRRAYGKNGGRGAN